MSRTSRRWWPLACAAALALAAQGCLSSATLTTATPIGEGKMEVFASPNFTGSVGDGPAPVPNVDLGMRFGVTEWLDVGVTVHTFVLVNLDLKLVLYDGEHFALAVDPTAGVAFTGVGELRLPLLADVKLGESLKLGLGAQYKVLVSGKTNDVLHVAGGMIAVEFRIDPRFYLMPHVSILAGIGDIGDSEAGVITTTGIAAKIRFGGP